MGKGHARRGPTRKLDRTAPAAKGGGPGAGNRARVGVGSRRGRAKGALATGVDNNGELKDLSMLSRGFGPPSCDLKCHLLFDKRSLQMCRTYSQDNQELSTQ